MYRAEIGICASTSKDIEIVKVQEPVKMLQLIEQLGLPELSCEYGLSIAIQLLEVLPTLQDYTLPINTSIGNTTHGASVR
jgi:hypothetical protein